MRSPIANARFSHVFLSVLITMRFEVRFFQARPHILLLWLVRFSDLVHLAKSEEEEETISSVSTRRSCSERLGEMNRSGDLPHDRRVRIVVPLLGSVKEIDGIDAGRSFFVRRLAIESLMIIHVTRVKQTSGLHAQKDDTLNESLSQIPSSRFVNYVQAYRIRPSHPVETPAAAPIREKRQPQRWEFNCSIVKFQPLPLQFPVSLPKER